MEVNCIDILIELSIINDEIIPLYREIDNKYKNNYSSSVTVIERHLRHISSYMQSSPDKKIIHVVNYLKTAYDSFNYKLKQGLISEVELKS